MAASTVPELTTLESVHLRDHETVCVSYAALWMYVRTQGGKHECILKQMVMLIRLTRVILWKIVVNSQSNPIQ